MASNIEEYLSSDDEGINEILTSKTRRTKIQRKWNMVSTFNNKQDAMIVVNSEEVWSFHYRNNTADGGKAYYRCNMVKRLGQQCEAGLYLLFNNNNNSVTMFRAENQHTHANPQVLQTLKLSHPMKEEIKKLFKLKIKPKKMFEILTEKGLKPKNKKQVSNYLVQLRKEIYGPAEISLGEFEQWCIDHSEIPDSDELPFVVSHQVKYCDELDDAEDEYNDGSHFRVLISTKRLLKNCSMSNKIHIDATYKLIWEGMPVIIVGTTDLDRHFHPIGIAVCTNEKKADFKFIFEEIKKINDDIEYLISDASNAIRNAFIEVFGDNKHLIMCWAHMRRNVTKKVDSLVEQSMRKEIIDDIDTLQLASSKKIFDKALPLLIKKWLQKRQTEFINYMKLQWFTTHQYWYEGAAQYTPSTNNSLESFNLVVKKEETFRERLPMSRFLELMNNSVAKWSKEYLSSSRIFSTATTIELSQWTKGYQWAKTNVNVSSAISDDSIQYFCPSNQQCKASEEEAAYILEMRWKTFEQFKRKGFKVWIVNLPKEAENWMHGCCTCPEFLKKFICFHIIGLAIRLKYIKPPPAAKQIPIGQKRSRGRPKLATRALLID